MKIIGMLIILFFPFSSQAACACNCDLLDRSLCAPSYSLENPCGGICPTSQNSLTPPQRTACPTQKVYIPEKGRSVWISLCFD